MAPACVEVAQDEGDPGTEDAGRYDGGGATFIIHRQQLCWWNGTRVLTRP